MKWIVVLWLALTAGCASLPADQATKQSVAERQSELLAIERWQLIGRIALNAPGQSVVASLDWQQQLQDFDITLTAALGRGMRVTQTGRNATLTQRGEAARSGASAEALVLDQLRVRVPFVQMGYWLRGLPGSEGQPKYDNFGRLRTLAYRDPAGTEWKATVKRYQQSDTLDLPALIEVVGGDYQIRVSIRQWLTNDAVESPPSVSPARRLTIPSTGA